MLVMDRNIGGEILIGNNIVVTLVASKDGRARIGITAPKEIPVHRREVADAIAARAFTTHDDGCPLTADELPPVIAPTDAFDHTQFDDEGTPPDLARLGITNRPKQPR